MIPPIPEKTWKNMLKIQLAGNKPMSGTKSCPGAGSWLKGTDGEREGTMDPNQIKFISLIPSQFAGDTHTIAYIYIVGLVDGPLDTTSFTRSAVPFRAQYCPWLWIGSCARTSRHKLRCFSCVGAVVTTKTIRHCHFTQTNSFSLVFPRDSGPWLWIGRKWFIIC